MDRESNPSHRKRKRAPSDAVINPLSHPPDTLRQFTLAGYPPEQPLPSQAHRGFPHRPIPTQRRKRHPSSTTPQQDDLAASDADIDTATEAGSAWLTTTDAETTTGTDPDTDNPSITTHRRSSRSRKKKDPSNQPPPDAKTQPYASRLGALTAVLRRCLAENGGAGDDPDNLARARRAFGLLARARVRGRPVDLRQGRLWEEGVAVLMREGEVPARRRGRRAVGVGGGRGGLGEGDGGAEADADPEEGGFGQGGREEEEQEEEDEVAVQAREEQRLARLKAYYTYLIQQYPYSKQHASAAATGVLEFQVALFSAETEAAYASHRRALARLRREEDDNDGWDDDEDDADRLGGIEADLDGIDQPMMDYDHDHLKQEQTDAWGETRPASPSRDDDDHHLRDLSRGERRRRKKEDELRLAALARITDIAQRMDTVMETVPFSRDHELLRLRAMVALYMGDLYVPPAPRSATEDRESRRARAGQRRAARGFLQRIKDGRGELKEHDEMLLQSLESDDEEESEDEKPSGLPMFSSMGS